MSETHSSWRDSYVMGVGFAKRDERLSDQRPLRERNPNQNG
jgi:hypothetical protein